jgi:hypothetical protein
MRLHGAVTDPGGAENERKTTWLIDGKEVARGLDAFVAAPSAGRHTAELRAGTGRGAGTAQIDFVTIDLEREAQKHEQHPG